MFRTQAVESNKTHILQATTFFLENCAVEKYDTVCEMRISHAAEEFATCKTQDDQIYEECMQLYTCRAQSRKRQTKKVLKKDFVAVTGTKLRKT